MNEFCTGDVGCGMPNVRSGMWEIRYLNEMAAHQHFIKLKPFFDFQYTISDHIEVLTTILFEILFLKNPNSGECFFQFILHF